MIFYPPPKSAEGYRDARGLIPEEAWENNGLLTEDHHARLIAQHGKPKPRAKPRK
ncbi:MAG: hypothetical protein JO137_13115 [Hyphomicrobiales bacterium]|nr:hypothetical protein [Hyphomicrobiales bacterium]